MASAQSKIFNILLRLINKKGLLKRQFAIGRFSTFTSPDPPAKILKTCDVHKYQSDGFNVFTLKPRHHKPSGKHILYFHGGAFVTSFILVHWNFLEYLVANSHCTITAPDYPLAPRYTYKESIQMVTSLYKSLLSTTDPKDLILMGDSAGGGLALAFAQKIKDENVVQPKQIILLSPWLDLTLTNPAIEKIDAADPFLGIEGLHLAAKAYAGGTHPGNHLLSPIYGSVKGLGRVSIFIGTKEILLADARKFKALAESQSVEINYFEYEDMIHDWMLLSFPESKKAKQQIVALLKNTNGLVTVK